MSESLARRAAVRVSAPSLAGSPGTHTSGRAASTSTLAPPSMGHIFKTLDNGATWIPIHGNGTAAPGGGTLDLPNIPVYVVPGSSRNFKVTQPGDLEIAEFYLAGMPVGVQRALLRGLERIARRLGY